MRSRKRKTIDRKETAKELRLRLMNEKCQRLMGLFNKEFGTDFVAQTIPFRFVDHDAKVVISLSTKEFENEKPLDEWGAEGYKIIMIRRNNFNEGIFIDLFNKISWWKECRNI